MLNTTRLYRRRDPIARTREMAALRPRTLLPAWGSALLVWTLCWSSAVCQEKEALPGFVTNYVTPVANLNVSQLVGRWYMVEHVVSQTPQSLSLSVCPVLDFYYDDNNTLMAEPYTLRESEPASPHYTVPVGDNGVWDLIRDGVRELSYAIVDLSHDYRYLALTACTRGDYKDCRTFVLVRHIEDAGRHDELTEVHRRLARAGVDHADKGYVRDLEFCRSIATPSPGLPAETDPCSTRTEWTTVTYLLGNATNAL